MMPEGIGQIRNPWKTQPPRLAGGGFSLVELLVMITIVLVMVSLLLPVLSSAKDRARAVACAANLRQTMMLLYPYSSDNRGHYMKTSWEAASEWMGTAATTMVRQYQLNSRMISCPGSPMPAFKYQTAGYSGYGSLPGIQTHFRVMTGRGNRSPSNTIVGDGAENDANLWGWQYAPNVTMAGILAAAAASRPRRPMVTEQHVMLAGPSNTIAMQDIFAFPGTDDPNNVWRGYYGGNWGPANHLASNGTNCRGFNSVYFDGHINWLATQAASSSRRYKISYYVYIYY